MEKELGDTAAAAADSKLDEAGHRGADLDEDFYLAVSRDALEGRWFMSAYLQQYFRSGPQVTARTLGTRVVEFRLQNEKLYVVDASDLSQLSDTFDPELIIEAYPLVDLDRFSDLPNSSDYILIDPAAGLNRFSAISNSLATPADPTNDHALDPIKFEIELSFLQRFRQLADGAAFDQVFTGYADQPITSSPGTNAFQASGTLTVSFRRYREGQGFTKFPMPSTPYFFEQGLLAPTGNTEPLVAKWNIRPGMEPIKWEISRGLLDIAARYPDVDVVGAVKAGITGWNDAFGFEVLTAEIAEPGAHFSDDDRNFFIVDPDIEIGFAFANFRTNPISGEVRGASVFFGSRFFDPSSFSDDEEPAEDALQPNPPVPGLLWNGLGNDHLCALHVRDARRAPIPTGPSSLTANEKVERAVAHVVAHEIGHTFGLRHNWKGSLQPPTSSVMEYAIREHAVATPTPQAYDHEAIAYLYGGSGLEPTQPFCTDGDHSVDPECSPFDSGARPLTDHHAPAWEEILGLMEQFPPPPAIFELIVRFFTGSLMAYMRGADEAVANEAAVILTRALVVPQPGGLTPEVAAVRDQVMAGIMTLAFSGEGFPIAGPLHPSLTDPLLDQALRIGLNEDGIRSFASRRAMIDGLVSHQTNAALSALLTMRDGLSAQVAAGLPADEEVLVNDLIARIDDNTDPYFE